MIKRVTLWVSVMLVAGLAISGHGKSKYSSPDPDLTPGEVCTDDDPNFEEYHYDEQVAVCKRAVGKAEKEKIAEEYGDIPESEWSKYEFDHLIPLCAGGSNDIENLWPQPNKEAKEKDKVEDEVCRGMTDGTMTQKQAVAKIQAFFR